jgi:hypothetical protein
VAVHPGIWIGHVTMYFWYLGIFSAQAVALNRFIAIAFPIFYRRQFTNTVALVVFGIVWMFALMPMRAYTFGKFKDFYFKLKESYRYAGCNLYFDPQTFAWSLTEESCTEMLNLYRDLIGVSVLIDIALMFDVTNFCIIRRFKQGMVIQGLPFSYSPIFS